MPATTPNIRNSIHAEDNDTLSEGKESTTDSNNENRDSKSRNNSPCGGSSTSGINARAEAFRSALRRYASGQDVDVVKFYDEVEAVISRAGEGGNEEIEEDEEVLHGRMACVLSCVEGEQAVQGFVYPVAWFVRNIIVFWTI